MSYRSRMKAVVCKARMTALDVIRAKQALEKADIYVESSFLDAMKEAADAAVDAGRVDALIEIPVNRCWFSGNHLSDADLRVIVSRIQGTMSGYFVGEDGELHSGFEIKDGKIARREIVVKLVEPSE